MVAHARERSRDRRERVASRGARFGYEGITDLKVIPRECSRRRYRT
jgi:hypothetical protein